MKLTDEKLKAAQAAVNRHRENDGKKPAVEFITFQYKHGFITMPVEEFSKLPKTKAKRLMRA